MGFAPIWRGFWRLIKNILSDYHEHIKQPFMSYFYKYVKGAEWCMETYLPTLSCCSVFIILGENHFHNTIHLSYENIVLLNQKGTCHARILIYSSQCKPPETRARAPQGGASGPIFRHDGPNDQRRLHLVFARFVWTGLCLRWKFCNWKLRFNLWWLN